MALVPIDFKPLLFPPRNLSHDSMTLPATLKGSSADITLVREFDELKPSLFEKFLKTSSAKFSYQRTLWPALWRTLGCTLFCKATESVHQNSGFQEFTV
ncbi:MAG: hypothetical protein LBF22_13135 [Deltaproteobacteria bacterium]|nr:hypothetical protein [Deltaproteobacteria bacterium]